MSNYYQPGRTGSVFDPSSLEPFRLSRSKLDLFMNCARCFYMDRRLGIGQPPGFPFTLNIAVDTLLKKEFDRYRKTQTPHPLFEKFGVDAVPFADARIEEWRDARKRGIKFHHLTSNFTVHGGIDDVWVNPAGELILVDYKATSKTTPITLNADWQIAYKRQIEVYQWLFRQNGFRVSSTGIFVYCNADSTRDSFDGRLEFSVQIIPYDGNDSWIEGKLLEARACLTKNSWPAMAPDCDYCKYRKAIKVRTHITQSDNRPASPAQSPFPL